MALHFERKEWTTKPPAGTPLRTDGHWSTQGLMAAWAFNEGAGSGVLDALRCNDIGSFTGTPQWSGGGLDFEESSAQRITCAAPKCPAIGTGQYTVLAGVVPEANTNNQGVLGFGNYDPTWAISSNGNPYVYDSANKTSATSAIPDGALSHVAYVRNSTATNGSAYYVNAQPAGTYTHSDSISAPSTITIGCDRNGAGFEFDGIIQYVYIYRRALSPAEISALKASPYQMFQPRLVPVVFEAGGTTYTESLYDTAVTVVALTDLTTRVESLLTTLSAFGSATDTVTASESVSTTAQAAGTVQAAATAVESVLSTMIGTGSVTDSVSGVAAETVTAVASSSAAVSDVLNLVESALVMVQSADSVVGVLVAVEELLTSMQAVASTQDEVFSGLVENVLTTAVGSASVDAVQTMQETVLVMAQAGASLATVAAFIEQVSATATATGSVVDAIVGSFLGSYLCGVEVRQRPYITEVRQRPYITEVRQRPNTMEVRQRCR